MKLRKPIIKGYFSKIDLFFENAAMKASLELIFLKIVKIITNPVKNTYVG